MSREPPPPLPGGYVVGDKAYYTGTGQTFKDGDRLEHGKQGEVVGPATGERHRGKGVKLLFTGNKGWVDCYLTQACRLLPPPTAPGCPIAGPLSILSPRRITLFGVRAHR